MKAQSNDSMYEDKQFQSLLSLTRSEYSKEIFISYFTKIAEVLVNDDDNTLISFLSFYNYMKLPIFLCKRIFSGIDRNRINKKTNYVHLENEYFIDSIIGKGCFGTVFKGENIQTKEKVAIKIIKKNYDEYEALECSRNEEDVLKFLMINPHKNIIHIKSVIESVKAIYIIQEYLPKGNLENFTYTFLSTLSTKETTKLRLDIIKQIADGMNHYMSYGIVHRDLKPQNILVKIECRKVQIKIIDFGFSTVICKDELLNQKYGTLLYLAPEVVSGSKYNNKVDIWSFSLISYFLLYGRHFFHFPSTCGISEKILNINDIMPIVCNVQSSIYENYK